VGLHAFFLGIIYLFFFLDAQTLQQDFFFALASCSS